jgi:hypothetical protein
MVYDTRDYWFLSVVYRPTFQGTLKNTNGCFRPRVWGWETPEDENRSNFCNVVFTQQT